MTLRVVIEEKYRLLSILSVLIHVKDYPINLEATNTPLGLHLKIFLVLLIKEWLLTHNKEWPYIKTKSKVLSDLGHKDEGMRVIKVLALNVTWTGKSWFQGRY